MLLLKFNKLKVLISTHLLIKNYFKNIFVFKKNYEKLFIYLFSQFELLANLKFYKIVFKFEFPRKNKELIKRKSNLWTRLTDTDVCFFNVKCC